MSLIFSLLPVAILAYVVYDFVKEYAAASGATTWDRLLAAGKGSATILLGRLTAFGAVVVTVLVESADWLGAPGIADTIKAQLTPQMAAVFAIALPFLFEFARRRTLGK